METSKQLELKLDQIHKKSYPAYKSLQGSYQFGTFLLSINHVQGDPFAAPSKLSIDVPQKFAGFPNEYFETKHRKIALEDYLTRLFYLQIEDFNFKAKGSGKSGLLSISRCGQQVLNRTSCSIDSKTVTIQLEVGFPANGRTINATELKKILFDFLPICITKSLFYKNLNANQVKDTIDLSDDQQYIREKMKEIGLCAFVANGSLLPRESGVSQKPLKNAVPFLSPKTMEVTFDLPHFGKIVGMGIKKGITLIVGGGYHGKSTLLKALEMGVYNHIRKDGREFVITDDTAVKIRAEDGRSVHQVDISMFINHLPNKVDTTSFQTLDASGSTSQAANVIEAMEAGTELLLIDEDTCATNFMIRDALMQSVISAEKEPITPFIDRIRQLYEQEGISTILVAGSCGAYFYIADTILHMDCYKPYDITTTTKKLCMEQGDSFLMKSLPYHSPITRRLLQTKKKGKGDRDRIKVKIYGKEQILLDKETIDLRYVEQLIDSEQTAALSYILKYAIEHCMDGTMDIKEIVKTIEDKIATKGMFSLTGMSYLPCPMAIPRTQEIYACLNRFRQYHK